MAWTFLSNHGHVAVQISRNPDIKLSELANLVGITERHARAIVQDLKDDGFIEIRKSGRRNTYRLATDLPLRHSAESDRTLEELLSIFR